MLLALLPRRILIDLVGTMLLALFGISFVMTLVLAMIQAGQRGLDPLHVILLMPYMMPMMLPFTLPSCLLYACTVVYGGMSGANEITAMKAGGIHVMRAVWPAVLLSLFAVGLGLWLTDQVIPKCNQRLTNLVYAEIENAVFTYLKTEQKVISPEFELYVNGVTGNRLKQPMLLMKAKDSTPKASIRAEEATLSVILGEKVGDPPRILVSFIGAVAQQGKPGETTGGLVKGELTAIPMPVPQSFIRESEKKLECLSYSRCYDRAAQLREEAVKWRMDKAWDAACSAMRGEEPEWSRKVDYDFRKEVERCERKAREAVGEVHMRINQSLAAIPFVLLGCPLAILFQRRDALQTFFACFLPIVTIFYPSMILALNVYKEGRSESSAVTGLSAIWTPSVVMAILSLGVLRKLFRY